MRERQGRAKIFFYTYRGESLGSIVAKEVGEFRWGTESQQAQISFRDCPGKGWGSNYVHAFPFVGA